MARGIEALGRAGKGLCCCCDGDDGRVVVRGIWFTVGDLVVVLVGSGDEGGGWCCTCAGYIGVS